MHRESTRVAILPTSSTFRGSPSTLTTMQLTILLLSTLATASAGRANLCFTAHKKSSLQCTKPLADGPISVYDDSEKPQKARKLFYKNGKLCANKSCKDCMAPGGAWVPCGSCSKMPASVMGANDDMAKPKAIGFALALVAVPLGVFMMLRKPAGTAASSNGGSASAGVKPAGIAADAVDFLLRFASAPWFPLVAALGTAINMFTIIFTGATVIIFLAAILGNRKRAHILLSQPSIKRS